MRVGGGLSPWMRSLLLVCFTLIAGCGGSGGGNGGRGDGGNTGAAGVTMQPVFDADCAWRSRCGLGSCEPRTCNSAIVRAEAVESATRCYETLACDGHDDQCELAALQQVPNAEKDIDSCIQRYRQSCPQYSDIDESLCLTYPWLIPSKQTELNQCFEQGTCAESCLMAVAAVCSP